MCRDCRDFIRKRERCVIHAEDAYIEARGSCQFFHTGTLGQPHAITVEGHRERVTGTAPLGLVTKEQSHYKPPPK